MKCVLKNIHKTYGSHIIFNHLNFDFSQCGFYLLCGKSGSGKTTLLNILAGFEDFNEGQRYIDNTIHIATIFQTYELINELTVYDNLKMIQDVYHTSQSHIIGKLGLTSILHQYPYELSSGQQQRVGIARALLQNPEIIICDEPTESLDKENKQIVLDLLKELSQHCVVIVASHDINIMETYYDYCYEINNYKLNPLYISHTHNPLQPHKNKISITKLPTYIHKIFHKQFILFNIILTLLMILTLFTIQLDQKLFIQTPQFNSLNAHCIYITNYTNKSPLNHRLIIPFEAFKINNKLKNIHVYPCPINQKVNHNEIIINEKLAKEAHLHVGQSIQLSYILEQQQYPLNFIIKDIIVENTKDLQIYYNYDYILSTLKNTPYSHQYPTQYDYLINHPYTYELQVTQNILQTYKTLQKQTNITLYHSLLTDFFIQQQSNYLYHIFFIIIEVLLVLITIYFIFYDSIKNKPYKNLSILNSIGFPLSLIKKKYFKQKQLTSLIFLIIPIIECLISLYLQGTLIPLCFSYIIGIELLSITLLIITMHHFNKAKIASFLKINQEQ